MERRQRTRRTGHRRCLAATATTAVTATVGIMLCATGCAGSGAAVEDTRAVGSAVDAGAGSGSGTGSGAGSTGEVETLKRAATALAEGGSARATTTMEMAVGGTKLQIRGDGVYDFRRHLGRLSVLLPEDPASTSARELTELLAPGALYMKNRGDGVPADKWVRMDADRVSDGNLVTGGVTDPLDAAELLRGTSEVTYLESSQFAGDRVRYYRGTADLAEAARVASPRSRAALSAAAHGFATAKVPFDVYLDDRGRIRKVRLLFTYVNKTGRTPVSVASTTTLYDFGVPTDVTLPEGRDIYAGRIAEQ